MSKPPKAFQQKHKVFTILEDGRLDAVACAKSPRRIPARPIFTSDEYDMYQSSRSCASGAYMVSSRYHGHRHLHAEPCRFGGVTMDERIRNLMRERGHQHLFLTVDEPTSAQTLQL